MTILSKYSAETAARAAPMDIHVNMHTHINNARSRTHIHTFTHTSKHLHFLLTHMHRHTRAHRPTQQITIASDEHVPKLTSREDYDGQ